MTNSISRSTEIYDVIGVGIGPFNLGMAALLEPVTDVKALFLEQKAEFDWHPGMMINGTTLQVPFLADLVSMADVSSSYSFLRYLQEHNRLYQFYFFEKFHIPRKEYNHYCRWVSNQLASCRFGMEVQSVSPYVTSTGVRLFEVTAWNFETGTEDVYLTKHLAIGIGSVPSVPKPFEDALGKTVFHTADYMHKKSICREARSVAVIGSGQSAAEVFLDVAKQQEEDRFSVHWFTRSKGFFPMEYSKLGLEYFSPDYTNFFYELPQEKKDALLQEQDLLYKGISADTIAEIYDYLYERSACNETPDIELQAMTEMAGIEKVEDTWKLYGWQNVKEEKFEVEADVVILATGYREAIPRFLSAMKEFIAWDEKGRYQVTKDYCLKTHLEGSQELFIQNGEMHTHGVGAPDLGLGAYRNSVIINQLAGREVYSVSTDTVFQTFGQGSSSKKRITVPSY
ncbi:lysine N(6)-hydroxylase/L-ornithine N(5)-oxygenase family protein [Halobacillus salinarum]|uniref:L-lysine N6-monooxygenase MbtG n=1 Tax=Halobacillus salinarum TaxID=2932257 RepID=A0ABY4EHJ1_9BACI|nr:lysine N(6)-hydroxylase/L-ornithine N(5)-oxygenase family protein [Halobacillus salinarum]UOQ43930.1 lysine N(6)-hydroxylase/L-ornithine N(5)-oxygenase family protein [Halobacillus salinarum]